MFSHSIYTHTAAVCAVSPWRCRLRPPSCDLSLLGDSSATAARWLYLNMVWRGIANGDLMLTITVPRTLVAASDSIAETLTPGCSSRFTTTTPPRYHLLRFSRGSMRFYHRGEVMENHRQPQYILRRNPIDGNQNVNLPQDNRSLSPTKTVL